MSQISLFSLPLLLWGCTLGDKSVDTAETLVEICDDGSDNDEDGARACK